MQNSSYYFIFTPRSLFIIQSHCKSEVEYQWRHMMSEQLLRGMWAARAAKASIPPCETTYFQRAKQRPAYGVTLLWLIWCHPQSSWTGTHSDMARNADKSQNIRSNAEKISTWHQLQNSVRIKAKRSSLPSLRVWKEIDFRLEQESYQRQLRPFD